MTILVTRPEPAAAELIDRLHTQGKVAWSLPLITFSPGIDLNLLPQKLATLHAGDPVFLLSKQVIYFAQHAVKAWPTNVVYYAIGRSTALAFHTISGLTITYPEAYENSEKLIQLTTLQAMGGKRALILRGNAGRELLADTLRHRGVEVNYAECYQRCQKYYDGVIEGRRWRDRHITTLVVTSGEMLQQLYSLFSEIDREEWLLRCRMIVASERLATLAKMLGWQDIQVADSANNDALLRVIC